MSIVDEIREAWGWVGISPAEIVGENDFGNLIIRDTGGRYWRLCPEDLYCKLVASNREELDDLSQSQDFLRDWTMTALVEQARNKLGPLAQGRKYCLKIPAVLGGPYGSDNLGSVSLADLIRFSGHAAKEIKDLPDGAKVRFKIID